MSVYERDFEALDYGAKQKASLTEKQYLVYSYLMSISKWNATEKEKHYYVYKNSFKIKDAVEIIGISQPTWRSAITKLKEEGYITDVDYAYQIYVPNSYAPLHIELIAFLVKFGKVIEKGGCIVSVYSVIYKYWQSCLSAKQNCDITVNQLHKLFIKRGHKDSVLPFEIMLDTFQSQGLIAFTKIADVYKGQNYNKYRINYVNTQMPSGLKNKGYGPDDITQIVDALINKKNI